MSVRDLASAGSLLQPSYIGYQAPAPLTEAAMDNILTYITYSLPSVIYERNTIWKGQMTKAPVRHKARPVNLVVNDGVDAQAVLGYQLGVGDHVETHRTLWRLAIRTGAAGEVLTPALPEGLLQLRLTMMSFRVSEASVEALPQLAMTRWLMFQALRAVDPEAVIMGAPRAWDPHYWMTEELATAAGLYVNDI